MRPFEGKASVGMLGLVNELKCEVRFTGNGEEMVALVGDKPKQLAVYEHIFRSLPNSTGFLFNH